VVVRRGMEPNGDGRGRRDAEPPSEIVPGSGDQWPHRAPFSFIVVWKVDGEIGERRRSRPRRGGGTRRHLGWRHAGLERSDGQTWKILREDLVGRAAGRRQPHRADDAEADPVSGAVAGEGVRPWPTPQLERRALDVL